MFSKATLPLFDKQKIKAEIGIFEAEYMKAKTGFEQCLHEKNVNNIVGNTLLIAAERLVSQLDALDDEYEGATTTINDWVKLKIKALVLLSRLHSLSTEAQFIQLDTIILLVKAFIVFDDNLLSLEYADDKVFQLEVSYCLNELMSYCENNSSKSGLIRWYPYNNYASTVVQLNILTLTLEGWCPRRIYSVMHPETNLHERAAEFTSRCNSGIVKLQYYQKYMPITINSTTCDANSKLDMTAHFMATYNQYKSKYTKQERPTLESTLEYANANLLAHSFIIQTNGVISGQGAVKNSMQPMTPLLSTKKNHAEKIAIYAHLMTTYIVPNLDLLVEHIADIEPVLIGLYCQTTLECLTRYSTFIHNLLLWNSDLKAKSQIERHFKNLVINEIFDGYLRFEHYAVFQTKILEILIKQPATRYNIRTYANHVVKIILDLKCKKATIENTSQPIQKQIITPTPKTTTKQQQQQQKRKPKSKKIQPSPLVLTKNKPEPFSAPALSVEIRDIHQTLKNADQAKNTKHYVNALSFYESARQKAELIADSELQVHALDGLLSLGPVQLESLLVETDKLLSERLRTDRPLAIDKQRFLETALQDIDKRLQQLAKMDGYYRPLLEQGLTHLAENQQENAKAGYAMLLKGRDVISDQLEGILYKYELVRQSKERFILRLGAEVKATLPADNREDIWSLGYQKFKILGEKNKLHNNVSDFANEKAFLSTLDGVIGTISNTKAKVFVSKCIADVVLTEEINALFGFLHTLTNTHNFYLVGSQVLNLLLNKWEYKPIQANDYDFLSNLMDKGQLISAGFHHVRQEIELYKYRFKGMPVDLYCVKEELVQSLLTRDFTITALAVNAQGMLLDPTKQGCTDLKKGNLSTIGNAVLRIQADPIIAIRAIKYIMRGFKPDAALIRAINQWQPDVATNYSHLHAVVKSELQHSDRQVFIQYLIETQLLTKMFGIDYKDINLAKGALETKLNLEPVRKPIITTPIPFQFFTPDLTKSNAPSYKEKLVSALGTR